MTDTLLIPSTDTELSASNLDDPAWQNAATVVCDKYWSGEPAPDHRHFETRLLWSASALQIRFESVQGEPLIISNEPDLDKKTIGLWDRDVCEIFITPGVRSVEHYYEFEVAPTGEWVDLAIRIDSEGRKADTNFRSGFESAAKIGGNKIVSAMKIPWRSIGGTPSDGEVRLGNLYRCVGQGPNRGYLAWQPTFTEIPDFHVPRRFGKFRFVA